MRYRPDLDGIRAAAILAVMAYHTTIGAFGGGWLGVDVFFVLSGFLITTLLLREFDDTGRISWARFYGRRALRLYPALIAIVVAGLVFFRDFGDHGTLRGYGTTALLALTYTEDLVYGLTGDPHGNMLHTWSLSVEEHFYLIWPLALMVLLPWRRRASWWVGGAAVASWLAMAATVHVHSADGTPYRSYILPWSVAWTLLVGCGLAVIVRSGRLPRILAQTRVGVTAAVLAVLATLAAARLPREPHMVWESALVVLGTAVLIAHLDTEGGLLRRLLGWAPLAYVGRRSYGLYLWHFPILVLLQRHLNAGGRLDGIAMVVLAFAAAEVSYRVVERPFLRLKSRIGTGKAISSTSQPAPNARRNVPIPGGTP
jgi:peptidoglycan/LPS O-acetylase OafA/YrhL